MVTIRLARGGAKKRPYFHITVADSRRARDGKYIERVGFFNPIASAQGDRLNIDHERLEYWVSKGAQISDTVKTLVKQSKLSPEDFAKLVTKKEKLRLANLEKKKASAQEGEPPNDSSDGAALENIEGQETISTSEDKQQNNEDNTMEKTEDIIDKVAEGAKEVTEEASEAVKDVAEGAVDVAEDVVETAEDVVEDAVDVVKDVAEGAVDVAEDVTDTAKEVASDLAEGDIVEAAKDVAEGAVDVVEDVVETAEDVVEDAVDAVKDVAEGAADAVEDAVEAVKDAFTSDDSKDDK